MQFSGMKRTQVLCGLWLSLLLALGGCSSETDFLPAPVGTDIQLAVSIETPSVNGRMQTGPSGNEAFQLSDRISLWVTSMDQSGAMSDAPAIHPVQAAASGADCYTLEWTEHGWMPALSWKDLTGEHFQFRAVYPAQPNALSEGFVHTVATDQREAVHYGSSDLLLASATVQRGQVVELHFRHQMSLIEVNLTSARTFTAEQLAQAEVRVRACPSIEVEGRTGNLGAVGTEVLPLIGRTETPATYCVIVPPQPIQTPWKKGWIEIEVGGETFTYSAPRQLNDGTAFEALLPGQRLKLTLKLEKNEPVEDWVNQIVWTYGLKDMPAPSTWGYAGASYDSEGKAYPLAALKWQPSYGWYDCNKKNPIIHSGGDSEMCWAAASANMLYWWLEQNQAYVKKLGYQGPSRYVSASDCEIFAHYKQHFPNEGRNVYEALDWFLTGRDVSPGGKTVGFRGGLASSRGTAAGSREAGSAAYKGFFQQVLGEKTPVAHFYPTSDVTLTEVLKKAFRNREAIECNILFANGYMHAINIWGAKFDEQGEVTHLYITDNNDSDLDVQNEFDDYLGRFQTQAGILEKAVEHRNGSTYMESSKVGVFSMQIIQVCTLGLMQEQWEAYFAAEHP